MTTLAPRRNTLTGMKLTLLLTFAHATNDAFTNILPVFLPTLQLRFGVGEAVLAILVATVSLSANVLQPFVGALADRWGRRRTAALGLMTSSILMSFIAVSPNLASLIFILALGGLGSAIFHPAAVSMARASGSGRRSSLNVSIFAAGGAIGTAAMPIIVLGVIRSYGIQHVPLLAGAGVLVGLILFLFTPRQEQPLAGARPALFDMSLLAGPIGLLSAAGVLRAIAFITFTNAIPLYLVSVRGFAADASVIGWTLSAYSAAAALGGVVAGLLEPSLGRRKIVAGSMLLALPVLVTVLLVPAGGPGYFLLVALGGLLTNGSVPLLVVSAQDLAPHAVGTASGMLMGFTWGIAGVLYIGFGSLQQVIGIVPAMLAGFVFLLPAALLAYTVMRKSVLEPDRD